MDSLAASEMSDDACACLSIHNLTKSDVFDERLRDLCTLVALKLDDLTFFVIDEGAVACILLLEVLEELLRVVLVRYALDGRQSLTTITLLNTNMDVFRCTSRL